MKLGHAIANYITQLWDNDLKLWLKALMTKVSHDVVDALIPMAEEAIQEIVAGGGTVSVATVAEATAKKAATLAATVAEHDLAMAVAGALAARAP